MTDDRYCIEPVWQSASDELRESVVRFWHSEGALSGEAVAEKRVHELIVVAKTHDQKIAAVSTARKVLVHQLGLKAFYYRMFVGHQHRIKGLCSTDLVRRVLVKSYETLNDRYQHGHDQECAGLYMEIENPSIKRNRNETVWTDFGANVVFIGKTPKQDHARIWYFDGSRVQ